MIDTFAVHAVVMGACHVRGFVPILLLVQL